MRTFPTPPQKTSQSSHWQLVREWMRQVGGDFLRSVDGDSDADTLAAHMLQAALNSSATAGPEAPGHHGTGQRGALSWDRVEALADDVAAYLLETFRPAYKPRFTREQAAAGGRASKRTSHLLGILRELDWRNLSITETARLLHCHERTVSTLRKTLKTEAEVDELDALLALVPDPEPQPEPDAAEPHAEPLEPVVIPDTVPAGWSLELELQRGIERDEREALERAEAAKATILDGLVL